MITRIELKNFMSHPHTVIEPAEGLTVLVGDNNTGKSAVINALQVLCNNLSGDYMVRHGAKECLVRVETDEGHVLEWRRKGKVVSYRINGRDIHRLGRAIPEDLHSFLRLPRVEAESETFDIHFGEQKSPIFLLNTSPAKRAAFFASSSDTIKLIEMQSLHKRKVQDSKWRETRLSKEEERYEGRLEKLAPVDEMGEKLDGLEAEYKALEDRCAEIGKLRRKIEKLIAAKRLVRRRQEAVRVTEGLAGPPELNDCASLGRIILDMGKIRRSILQNKAQAEILAGLAGPPDVFDTPLLKTIIHRLQKNELEVDREEKLCAVLEAPTPPPEMRDPSALKEILVRMDRTEKQVWVLGKAVSCLSGLLRPPEPLDLTGLRDNLTKLEKAKKDQGKREAELKRTKETLSKAEADLRKFIDRTGTCPTCGQGLDLDRLLSRAAVSGGGKS